MTTIKEYYDRERKNPVWLLKPEDVVLIDNGQRTETVEITGRRRCKCSNMKHHKIIFKYQSGKQVEMSLWDFKDIFERVKIKQTIYK